MLDFEVFFFGPLSLSFHKIDFVFSDDFDRFIEDSWFECALILQLDDTFGGFFEDEFFFCGLLGFVEIVEFFDMRATVVEFKFFFVNDTPKLHIIELFGVDIINCFSS